jgi:hypothetical protein
MLLLASLLARAETYPMANAGVTFRLGAGWGSGEWSDWDISVKHPAGMAMQSWYVAWQMPVGPELGPALVKHYTARLEGERARDIRVAPASELQTWGTTTVLPTEITFGLAGGGSGAAWAAAFEGEGKVLHAIVYASTGPRARATLQAVVSEMTMEKPPAEVSSAAQVSTRGFTAAPPSGWRAPLPAELDGAIALARATPVTRPQECTILVRPGLNEDTAAIFLCKEEWRIGILDKRSFAGESEKLKALVFSKAAENVPPGKAVETRDRTAAICAPPINDNEVRMAIVPASTGQVVAWAVGAPGAGALVEAGLVEAIQELTFDGPDGGKPQHTFGEWVVHTVTYNPFHPAVVGCTGLTCLFITGLGGAAFFLRPKHTPGNYA